jgi:hypothetical protein
MATVTAPSNGQWFPDRHERCHVMTLWRAWNLRKLHEFNRVQHETNSIVVFIESWNSFNFSQQAIPNPTLKISVHLSISISIDFHWHNLQMLQESHNGRDINGPGFNWFNWFNFAQNFLRRPKQKKHGVYEWLIYGYYMLYMAFCQPRS